MTISTTYSTSEVLSRLSSSIQKPHLNIFSYPQAEPPFIGKMNGNRFSVYRAIQYRNSFLPRIKGVILPKGDHAEISIRMILHPIITAFMCVWMGGIVFFIALVITFHFKDELLVNPAIALLMPLGMMTFGYLLMTVPFQVEAKKAEAIIKNIIT